jgi:hypothetical protein
MATVRYTTINGEVIAEKRNGVRRLYTPDPLGSTVALLDNTQTQTDTFTYWPYGEVRTRTGTTTTPFQFVGTRGLYRDSSVRIYARLRYIDAVLGRWLTTSDFGGRDQKLNPYVMPAFGRDQIQLPDPAIGYCGPNPSRKYDPCCLPGQTDPSEPELPDPTPGPKNPADSCCKDHDCCWLQQKRKYNIDCKPGDARKPCADCNRALCTCIARAACDDWDTECKVQKALAGFVCRRQILPFCSPGYDVVISARISSRLRNPTL